MPDRIKKLYLRMSLFNNERQKAEVTVVKQDKDTKRNRWKVVFSPCMRQTISKNADGTVVVKKGTLIEKATTGAGWKGKIHSRSSDWIIPIP